MGIKIGRLLLSVSLLSMVLWSCENDAERKVETRQKPAASKPAIQLIATPSFNQDTAFAFVQKQVDFGPRVPNTDAQLACAKWMEAKMKSFGLETSAQQAEVIAYNDQPLRMINVMGRYRPELKDRVLLCAHWDTRPYADRDTRDLNKPIDGANDGASGVGVLLELARAISKDSLGPNIGFDIVFFDTEDYGKPESSMVGTSNDSWCLGSQYWAKNIPFANYRPRYGILLDMVGASNAVFPKEAASMNYAPSVVNNVWSIAQAMGHKDYFPNINGNPITDDHIYLNTLAGIPTIDIIHYEMGRADFGSFHHTHEDNMDIIDANALKVVGDVLMQVIYKE